MDRVLACITTRDGNPPTRVRELVEATAKLTAKAGLASVALSIQQDRYSVAFCRNQAVHDAINGKFTHLFFIDDDVYVPENTLPALLEMGRSVAAGVYPSIKTLYPGDLKAETYITVKYQGHWLRHWFQGTRRVDAVGAGCLLIKTSVFEKVTFPWFRWPEMILPDGRHERVSDDLDFCQRCNAAGIGVWANGDIRCGHVKPVDIANFMTEEAVSTEREAA